MQRQYINEISEEWEGRTVRLAGWVYRKRTHGNLIFFILRDGTGFIQVAIHRDKVDEKSFSEAEKATVESSVIVEGTVAKDPRAPGGLEIRASKVQLVGLAETWPITKTAGRVFLLDNRHLHLRSEKVRAVLLVRHEVCRAAREWLESHGFVEVHAPIIITAACEGGATLFPLEYFGRQAYLTQSAQLYEEAAITSLGKVYTIAPSFRAEKSRTRAHLTEFWQIECEVAFATHEDIMKIEEELVKYICDKVVERRSDCLKTLGREFRPPKLPFERITYDEALEILESKGMHVEWGEDFGADEIRTLSLSFDNPFFITRFPLSARSFYHMPEEDDPRVSKSSDMIAPEGYGEISTGGQRIHDYDLLVKRIKEQDLPLESYKWYLDLRKYGTVPQSGFGIGVERLVRWICGLYLIREACLFPRTPTRVYP